MQDDTLERVSRIKNTPIIRALNEAEKTMILNPRGMAEMHWSELAENLNPYKKHSHEWNQYENKHAELEARFDRSF